MSEFDYKRIGDRTTPEPEKRWMSWTVLVEQGRKQSYVRPSDAEVAKRRARGRRQRQARRVNHGR